MNRNWENLKLKDIGTIFSGNSINAKIKEEKYFTIDSGIPYIATKDISYSLEINYDNGINIPDTDIEKFKIAPSGSVIICAEGGSAGRKLGILNQDVCFVNKLFALTPNEKVIGKYIFYWYQSNNFQKDFQDKMTGLIGGVSKLKFQNIKIPIPSIVEQKQIVEILDKAFESIEQAKINIEKNIENTKEFFQSRLNEIFSQKGDGWEEKELGKLAEFRNGLNFNKSSKGETFKIVGVSNFKDNFYVDNDSLEEVTIDGKLKELDLLKDGDIVAVRSNGNPNLIGRCMLLANIEEKISFSGFTIRIRLIDKNIYPLFLNYFLKSSYIKNELIKSGNGTDIRNLNQQSLSSLVFKYPLKIEEQKRIVYEINNLSEQTKQLEKHYKQKLKNLEELKKSILQKAFSGELLK